MVLYVCTQKAVIVLSLFYFRTNLVLIFLVLSLQIIFIVKAGLFRGQVSHLMEVLVEVIQEMCQDLIQSLLNSPMDITGFQPIR